MAQNGPEQKHQQQQQYHQQMRDHQRLKSGEKSIIQVLDHQLEQL